MGKILSKREQNKVQKKASLIDAAERLFSQKGFDGTSIDDVAKEAGLTKRTLYQYFTSKEDLFFAVTLKGGRQLTADYEEAFGAGNTALEKIRSANQAYLQFYRENMGMFQLLNYQPTNQQNCAASPYFMEMMKLNGVRIAHYMELVNMGKADGSINPELDIRKAIFFAFFSAFSLLFAVSSQDKSMWAMMELDESDFLNFSFDLLADALK